MMYKTHIIFAIFLYLLLSTIFHFQKNFFILFLISFGSLFPDIDSGKSYINKKIKFGKLVAMTSRHRGFWHSIFGFLLFFFFSSILFMLINRHIFTFYLGFGYLTHLIADSLTLSGIKPLWKFSNFELKWKIKTSGFFEYLLFFLLLIFTLYLLFPSLLNFTSYIIKIFA